MTRRNEADGFSALRPQILFFRKGIQNRKRSYVNALEPWPERIENRMAQTSFQGIVSPARSGTRRSFPKGSVAGTVHSSRCKVILSSFAGRP